MLVFMEGGNLKNLEKNPCSRDKNQQTQPTHDSRICQGTLQTEPLISRHIYSLSILSFRIIVVQQHRIFLFQGKFKHPKFKNLNYCTVVFEFADTFLTWISALIKLSLHEFNGHLIAVLSHNFLIYCLSDNFLLSNVIYILWQNSRQIAHLCPVMCCLGKRLVLLLCCLIDNVTCFIIELICWQFLTCVIFNLVTHFLNVIIYMQMLFLKVFFFFANEVYFGVEESIFTLMEQLLTQMNGYFL